MTSIKTITFIFTVFFYHGIVIYYDGLFFILFHSISFYVLLSNSEHYYNLMYLPIVITYIT